MIDAFGVDRPDLEVGKGWKKGLAAGAAIGAGAAAAFNPAVRAGVMTAGKFIGKAPSVGAGVKRAGMVAKPLAARAATKPVGMAAAGGAGGGAVVGGMFGQKRPKSF